MSTNDCWLIYTDDDRYIGMCYDMDVAQRARARGCVVVPYLDHVRPECCPEKPGLDQVLQARHRDQLVLRVLGAPGEKEAEESELRKALAPLLAWFDWFAARSDLYPDDAAEARRAISEIIAAPVATEVAR